MKIKHLWITLSIMLTVIYLSGCAVNVATNKYSLNSICITRPCHRSCATILVVEPTAQPGYETDQMIYMQCPYELKAFSRNSWAAPPHEMLTSLISQSLRNTCYFKAVVNAPYTGDVQFRLETRLIKLQHEFFCCPSRVRMILQVVLINNCTHCVIGERMLETVVIAPKNNPYGGVVAANQATRILLERAANFVVCSICGVHYRVVLPLPPRLR